MSIDPSVAAEKVWLRLTGDDEGRVCRDIPEEACHAPPQNLLRHVVALAANRAGDGLADAKLVLAWRLGALGAPTFLVGFLVPVREAGALLPVLGGAAGFVAGIPGEAALPGLFALMCLLAAVLAAGLEEIQRD